MNGVIVVLIIAGILISMYPVAYLMGWLATMLPLYFVMFKESSRKARELTDKDLATSFHRHKDESLGTYWFRRIVSFIGWNITTILVYWFLILYVIGSQTRLDEMTHSIATGLIK